MEKRIIRLKNCVKGYTYDQDKACTPEETVNRFMDRLQQAKLDVLKEVRRIDNGRLDIPVYFSVCGRDALETIGTRKQMGKGSTPEQSRASACMELGERFSFFSFLKDPANFIIGDYQEMRRDGYPVLDSSILLHSVHDSSLSPGELEELLQGLPMRWVWAANLTDESEVLVPFSWFYAINEFNGPSAGNTYEEAVLQGVSEVVERHVCARVTRERIPVPAIDPQTVTDPVARELIDKFSRCGIELFLHDFTLDTGIPTVAALAWDPSTFPDASEIVYTAGTTPNPDKALIRALTEVAQLAGDFNTGANYVASGLPKPRSLDEMDYLIPPTRTVPLSALPDLGHEDMLVEIDNALTALKKIGLTVLVVDTRHPQLQIPAIYTIIPGAHFRERAAGGDAVLFAAKLASELLPPHELETHLARIQEDHPEGYYLEFYRGRLLLDLGRGSEALPHLRRSLSLAPREEDIPYIYSYIGSAQRQMGQYREAVDSYRQGLVHDERRPDIHNGLGVCYFKLGDHLRAVDHFQRAVELNPSSAIDYANLALNQEKIGRLDEAMANYQIALSQDPTIEFAIQGLAGLMALKER